MDVIHLCTKLKMVRWWSLSLNRQSEVLYTKGRFKYIYLEYQILNIFLVWFGWLDLGWFVLVRFGLGWFGLGWFGLI